MQFEVTGLPAPADDCDVSPFDSRNLHTAELGRAATTASRLSLASEKGSPQDLL